MCAGLAVAVLNAGLHLKLNITCVHIRRRFQGLLAGVLARLGLHVNRPQFGSLLPVRGFSRVAVSAALAFSVCD